MWGHGDWSVLRRVSWSLEFAARSFKGNYHKATYEGTTRLGGLSAA